MRDAQFIAEAIRRAETVGFYPAVGQRAVDWECVAVWTEAVRAPRFVWLTELELSGCGFIIVASNKAIASGQHRILAGLMAGKPVPGGSISRLTCPLPLQAWR